LAQEFGRRVLPAGRSMVSNLRIARELGYVEAPPDLFVTAGESRQMNPDEVLVLASGTQGEPMSALSRLAVNEFKNVQVEEGDVVIMSARIIPGNERLISNLVNHFYRRGAEVYDSRHAPIHASGHGFQADLKLMMNLTRPQFFIPIHGEYRQLKNHAQLAEHQGVTRDRIRVIETGDILQISSDSAEIIGKAPVGRRLLDDGRREEVDEIVVRDRRFLSEDGLLVVVLRIDRFNGEIIGEPELVSRGLVPSETSDALMQHVSQLIQEIVDDTPVEEKQDEEVFREILIKQLKRFIRKQTGKRPVILPMMLEI
jgi:ribonuclease J